VEIAVCLKRVPDTAEADVNVDATGKDIVRDKLAFTINESDNYALEEALLAKEKHNANVTLVSVGGKESEEVLRMGLAKGATAAARIDSTGLGECDGIGIARVLAAWFKEKKFDVIFTGAIASDDGNSQVGPALAELLGLPHAAYVTKLDIQPGKLTVKRELEGGFLELKELPTPAVVTIQTGGNTPRYASIMGIKRAGAKPIDQAAAAKPESKTELIKVYVPEVVGAAQMIEGTVDEKAAKLATLLKEKGAV
jgi:electron transfer flavoprotein beta subunit